MILFANKITPFRLGQDGILSLLISTVGEGYDPALNLCVLAFGKVLDPVAFADDKPAQHGFSNVNALGNGIQGQNGYSRESAQAVGQGNGHGPHNARIVQKGHNGLAAGAHGVVNTQQVCHHGLHYGQDQYQVRG